MFVPADIVPCSGRAAFLKIEQLLNKKMWTIFVIFLHDCTPQDCSILIVQIWSFTENVNERLRHDFRILWHDRFHTESHATIAPQYETTILSVL